LLRTTNKGFYPFFFFNQWMMKLARNASKKLSGTAIHRIPTGNTLIFHKTTHISTKPVNQERKVVCIRLNFREIAKIVMENKSDHIPHIAPFTGSAGKVSSSDV
jgi:hypothetical protein